MRRSWLRWEAAKTRLTRCCWHVKVPWFEPYHGIPCSCCCRRRAGSLSGLASGQGARHSGGGGGGGGGGSCSG